MLRKDGQTDGSVTISLCNFVGEGIASKHKHRIIISAEIGYGIYIDISAYTKFVVGVPLAIVLSDFLRLTDHDVARILQKLPLKH